MNCPLCGHADPMVNGAGTVVEGDNSPDTPTKVYYTQLAYCRDKTCTNHNRAMYRIKHLTFPPPNEGEEIPLPIIETL